MENEIGFFLTLKHKQKRVDGSNGAVVVIAAFPTSHEYLTLILMFS